MVGSFPYFRDSLVHTLISLPFVPYQEYSFNGKRYISLNQRVTFRIADNWCKSRGQRLVTIKSEAVQDFVFNTFVEPTGYKIWLGATNEAGTKDFKWLADGSSVNSHYTNWAWNCPSTIFHKNNAITMYEDGVWHDVSFNDFAYVVCEDKSVQSAGLQSFLPNSCTFLILIVIQFSFFILANKLM